MSTITRLLPMLSLTVLLAGCGNSSSPGPGPEEPATGSGIPGSSGAASETGWSRLAKEYGYRQNLLFHDGNVYTSTHYTDDGVTFTDYHTAENDFRVTFGEASYIDENGRFYLFFPDAVPHEVETERWVYYDWAPFSNTRRIAGTSDYLISYGVQSNAQSTNPNFRTVLEFSDDGGRFYKKIKVNGEDVITNRLAPIGDNKAGTIMVTDQFNGGWRSLDSGRSWSKTLEDVGYLDLLFSSQYYPDVFYAFGPQAAMRSDDQGATWTPIQNPDDTVDRWVAGTVDSSNGHVVLWGDLKGQPDVLMESSTQGQSWSANTNGIPAGSATCSSCRAQDLYVNANGYFITGEDGFFLPKN